MISKRYIIAGFFSLIILTFSAHVYCQEEKMVFDKGVEQYGSGDYQGAIKTWEKLVSSGFISPDLYYNLGNAFFKDGGIPGAILYYEKALLIKPFNEDIQYNLEIARSYTVDSFETISELFYIRWFKMISLMFSSNYWALISLILFICTLGLLLIYLFSGRLNVKKLSFIAALFLLISSIITISFSYQNRIITIKKRDAIIFTPVVTGKSSPDESGNDLFVIHEGTRVKIEDELGEWYEIRLSDGNVGWIRSEDVRKI
ncbi:MAG: SH3 domain-containing protein [Bacteroidales bacterium]|nr:SH3 domain-containing protein [Bacteroidales bacterium]